jgi:hypothetical protein
MPGYGLLIGIPLVVMLIALLAIWQRERIHGPPQSRAWRWFYRALTMVLVLLAAYMLSGFFFAAAQPSSP